MPTVNTLTNVTALLPVVVLASASYQISGAATAIAGGTDLADAAIFTDTVTVTGIRATDKNICISPRGAIEIPAGLALISIVVSANDTLKISWKNTTRNPITPPAAGVWSVATLAGFLKA